MPESSFERFLPYTGVLAGVLFAVGGYLPKTSDTFGDPDAVAILNDNATRNVVAAVAMALCCVALLFFAAALRRALRSREGGESTYSGVAYAGTILVAASQAAQAWLMFAGADAADHHDKAAVSTLSYLGIDSWLPWVAASAAMLLATGLGGLHNAVLPRWLAIVTVVLGIACLLGPTGIAVWFATPVWLFAVGVVLGHRQEAERPVVFTHAHA
jgi:hypothetical protein